MNDDEHQKIIAMIRWQGVPVKYKRTMFGNYTSDTVVQIVLDALACYRSAMTEKDHNTGQDEIIFKPSGRNKINCTVDGPTIYYTYADEDSQIPHGMRRCTFLEVDPYQREGRG